MNSNIRYFVITTLRTLVRTASLIHVGRKPGSLLKQAKHCVRGLMFARQTAGWFEVLRRPELAAAAQNHPCLFQKLQRPYLNRNLNTRQRLAALEQHYHFMTACFSPAALAILYAKQGRRGAGITLANLALEEIGLFRLELSFSRHEKEGDLAIGLVDAATGAGLFTLTFSVTRVEPGIREIFIGGLQGNKLANDRDLIVAITRGLNGLRPKALLLFVLQTLAEGWGVTRLRAVSDANHIYRHWQKRRPVAASYDQWWTESGGLRMADGMFELPAAFVPREMDSLKASKRTLYRRRYRQLSEMAGQIKANQRASMRSIGLPSMIEWLELPGEAVGVSTREAGV